MSSVKIDQAGDTAPIQQIDRTSHKRVRITTPSSPSSQRNIRRKLNPDSPVPRTSSTRDPLKAAKEARLRRTRFTLKGREQRFKRIDKGKKPVRPVQNAKDDSEADIDSDEEEVQLAEARLFTFSSTNSPTSSAGPSSPTPGSAGYFPTQRTFPIGETLKPFARALTAPPTTQLVSSSPRPLNLPSSSRSSSSSPVPEHIRLRSRAQSFSTPRIPDVDEILGETTDEGDNDSGGENDSDVLDEIEEEYQEKYRQEEEEATMAATSVLLPSPFPNASHHKHDGSHHPSHSSNNRQMREASGPYAKGKRAAGRAVTATSVGENRKLGSSVTDLATGIMQLESPVVRRAQPHIPAAPTSPTHSDREESEVENGLIIGEEMQVDTATEGDDEVDEERVLSLTMPSLTDSDSDSETRMDIPSADVVRLHHQERIISLRSSSSLSFAGQRSRTLYRARYLTDMLEENPWIGSLKFARLVAIRRRGAAGGIAFFGALKRSSAGERRNPKSEGVERMLLGLQQYREKKMADQARRSLMRVHLNELQVLGMNQEWASMVRAEWTRLHSQSDFFRRYMNLPEADGGEQQAAPAEAGVIELDNSTALHHAPSRGDRARARRKYPVTLESYEAVYPEAQARYLARWNVNPAHFEVRRGAVAITQTWTKRFAVDDARESRAAEDRRQRSLEEERRNRRRRQEEIDREIRARRDLEMEQAAIRMAQMAQWQAEFEAMRRSESVERATPVSPIASFNRVDRQTQAMVDEAARELAAEIARNPHPPTYPASPTQNTPRTPPMRAATVVPVTPPLPEYVPNTYGQASPPPPPPYNAVSGYELVEIDDLLLDDDEEDEDDITDLLSEPEAAPASEYVPAPVHHQAPPQRILTLAEMQAEQQAYQAMAQAAEPERPARGSRCLIM